MNPPEKLDGADVVYWAWAEPEPFFVMPYSDCSGGIPIHGLAICCYPDSGVIYRFSCNSRWEVENDSSYDSLKSAKAGKSWQFNVKSISWLRLEQIDSQPKRTKLTKWTQWFKWHK